jgi:aminoglycoside phosphotransferase (APT) family kinase protein
MTADGWRSRVRGVLTDQEARVLMLEASDGTTLPAVDIDGFADEELEAVRRAFEQLLGARVAILRYLERSLDRERRRFDVVYILERLDSTWDPPPGATWLDRSALDDGHRELLLDHLGSIEQQHVPAERAPWARAGWLAEASEWIESSLAALGRAPTGPVEQVRSWFLSSVLRVPTKGGPVYFKATTLSPLFVDEGRVMQGLARLFRREVPRPLAIERSRRWMLLDDIGGPALGWDAPLEERESVLRVFAFMQVASSSNLDALLAMGCIDRRPAWLARETRKLLRDDEALAGLDEHETVRLRSLEPLVVALCVRLDEGGVPDALVHGDLHLGNVARVGRSYVFFDWTDACVAHPFLDLIEVHREEDQDVRARLRDAYLSIWTDYGSPEELLELWEVATPLAALNQAVSYRHILANAEPGAVQEIEWWLPHWLRQVLETDFDAVP